MRFDLEVAGYAVSSPPDAADQAALEGLSQKIRDDGIPAIFAENGFDKSIIDDIGADTGARVCRLYSDISEDSGQTYADLVRANADEIIRCLAPQ